MSQVTDVARVLLVAHASRQSKLAGWLRVEGEQVSYELRLATPEVVPFEELWDVVVLDGESLFDDERRLELMCRFGERPREASILFVCSRLPHSASSSQSSRLRWGDRERRGWTSLGAGEGTRVTEASMAHVSGGK